MPSGVSVTKTAVLPSARQAFLYPLVALSLLFVLFYGFNADFTLAAFWYQLQDQHWSLQHHWLMDDVMHRGVRTLNQLVVGAFILHFLWQLARQQYQRWSRTGATHSAQTACWTLKRRQAHSQLLLSLVLSLAGVAAIKHYLPMDCPWDLQFFGGSQVFTGLFASWPTGRAPNACFPAGHASIGFAWLGLYFFCLQLYPRLARPALVFSILLGTVLGLVQQLRGAHFFSHDIASALWCWSMACLCAYWPTLRRNIRQLLTPQSVAGTQQGTL